MGWIASEPAASAVNVMVGDPIPNSWKHEVLRQSLGCGINIKAQRAGFTVYDFSGWPQGLTRPSGTPTVRTIGEASKTTKPALIARLRLINSHLTLIHAASASMDGTALPVARVRSSDLYRVDYEDGSATPFWYRPMEGPLPKVVSMAEFGRIGVLELATLQLSLAWLDDVVAQARLMDFDLLNQTMAALATYDYALTVVAGWTVCELAVRRRGKARGISRRHMQNVDRLCDRLGQLNDLSASQVTQLGALRRSRNKWLHLGDEPDEQTASQALMLATEMLRESVPRLETRVRPGLLIL